MAENTPPGRDESEEAPAPQVPSHGALPPPPDVQFTRPTLGRAAPLSTDSPATGRGRTSDTPPSPADNAARMGAGLSAGITLAASVIVGFLIGQWIDRHWNHSPTPWGTLVMSLAGVAAGFLNLFRILGATDRTRRPK